MIVRNGLGIPSHSSGHTTLHTSHNPLKLNHDLHAPQNIKNLISMRRLTTENNFFVSFGPFGFYVNDFQTRIPLMRRDSINDLCPITTSSNFACLTSGL